MNSDGLDDQQHDDYVEDDDQLEQQVSFSAINME